MAVYEQWQLPTIPARILSLCDGVRTLAQVSAEAGLPSVAIAQRVTADLAATGAITLRSEPNRQTPIFVTGGLTSQAPMHMSVEITDHCNFTCDHCYVSASPQRKARRGEDDLVTLFDTMWANGVKVVELTGGECTTHPQFRDILSYAAATFHLVAIVSNGYLLGKRPSLREHVASLDNVSVQVSVDGDREFHDAFRKKRGAYDAAWTAIRGLKQAGVIVRVGMSVTEANVHCIPGVFEAAKAAGVDSLAVTPVAAFGRAGDLGLCSSGSDERVQRGIAEALAGHADDPIFDAGRIGAETMAERGHSNCGAGWRSFGINGATGEVRSCLYLTDSKKFGSVDEMDYATLFASPEMAMFRDAPSPSPHLDTCHGCAYIGECVGCFAKAFRVSESDYPECPWRKRYFPGMTLDLAGRTTSQSAFIPLSALTATA
jgi:radical SAM protein with 4Fe4S-binding SPASM domain